MSENGEGELSKYVVSVDRVAQAQFEQKNLLDEHNDLYLMTATQFRENISSILREDTEIFADSYPGGKDKDGRTYPMSFTFTTKDFPQITFQTGAGPCSLVFAFDSLGNFASAHIPRWELFQTDSYDPDVKTDQDHDIAVLDKFIDQHMADDYRIVITATNIDEERRKRVAQSIKDTLMEPKRSRVEEFYAEPRPSKAWDEIDTVMFLPGAFTKDGNNKVLLMGGSVATDHSSSLDDYTWMINDFEKQYERR